MTYNNWISDTSVDDIGAWSYVTGAGWKSVDTLVHNLADRVSKSGYLLMNFGPRANGEFPEGAKRCYEGMGKWLKVNGEAIYGTTPWVIAGEGPTKLKKSGGFNEKKNFYYTPKDIRFTTKDNSVYAIILGWPGESVKINSIRTQRPSRHDGQVVRESDIASITMLGDGKDLKWELMDDGLNVTMPSTKPCDNAYTLKITWT